MTNFKQFEEVMKLIRETGDRCIILMEGQEPYVVMGLESYRSLLSSAATKQDITRLSEEELLERINEEIAAWREGRAMQLQDYDLTQFRVDETALERPDLRYQATENPADQLDLPVVTETEADYDWEPAEEKRG